jgi:hypothetical protein
VVCKRTDSPSMDCPDLCLEAFWLQELEWVLEDCLKRSCWKNSIGMSVPRPCGSDLYVCSKSCWLCLTVVYWLLECNKVPLWNRTYDYVTISSWLCASQIWTNPCVAAARFYVAILICNMSPFTYFYVPRCVTLGPMWVGLSHCHGPSLSFIHFKA